MPGTEGKRKRESTPIKAKVSSTPETWFLDKRGTFAKMFPHLFLTGLGVATSLTAKYIRHLYKFYDGRFEQDPEFVTTVFSLKMVQTTMTQGYNCKMRNPDLLNELGRMINSGRLEEQLNVAKTCPDKRKEMDTLLGRFFNMFAKNTPFSPLSMARARGKVSGGKMRRNVGLQFITGAPPEHEDDAVLRIGLLTSKSKEALMTEDGASNCKWNSLECPLGSSQLWNEDVLKPFLRTDPSARIQLADRSPALVSMFFENEVRRVTETILHCPLRSKKSTPSRRGLCGKTSAAEVVVQLQGNKTQRLHYHIIARQHVCNVELFDLCACHPELQEKMRRFIDSVSSCSLPAEVLQWREDQDGLPYTLRDQPKDLSAPNPETDFEDYIACGLKKTAMCLHCHTKTCTKTERGQYCCRLAREAVIHEGNSTRKDLARGNKVSLLERRNFALSGKRLPYIMIHFSF